jgi:hypothetical protein
MDGRIVFIIFFHILSWFLCPLSLLGNSYDSSSSATAFAAVAAVVAVAVRLVAIV